MKSCFADNSRAEPTTFSTDFFYSVFYLAIFIGNPALRLFDVLVNLYDFTTAYFRKTFTRVFYIPNIKGLCHVAF